jgi:hypothetical protein
MRNTSRVILSQRPSGTRILTDSLRLRMAELKALRRRVVEAEQMAGSLDKESVVRAQSTSIRLVLDS